MSSNLAIVVGDVNNQHQALLQAFERASFTLTWSKNESYEIAFTAWQDGSLAYNLLKAYAHIWSLGQEWIITTAEPQITVGSLTTQITATHIGLQCGDVRTSTKMVAGEYLPNAILSHYFDGNKLGYSYVVHGKFDAKKIDAMGSGSGKDGLSLITDHWKDAVIFPDNRQINVYSSDVWGQTTGVAFRVGHDTDSLNLTIDPNDIVNMVKVYGKTLYDKAYSDFKTATNKQRDAELKATKTPYDKQLSSLGKTYRAQRQKEKTKEAKDELKKTYKDTIKPITDKSKKATLAIRQTASEKLAKELASLKSDPSNFVGVTYRDDQSIQIWGEHQGKDVTVKNETDTGKLLAAGKSAAKPNPTVSMTLDYRGKHTVHAGDIWFLDAKNFANIQTNVQVIGFTRYPFSPGTPTNVTLNNSRTTMTDINVALLKTASNALNSATNSAGQLAAAQIVYNTNFDTGDTSIGGVYADDGGEDYV